MQFDHYGSPDVLHVADVPRPSVTDGQVLVGVAAAGINPGEIAIRSGAMDQMFPAAFTSGQGSDFAGRVVEVGPGVTEFAPGDEVLGWSDRRSAQAGDVVSDRQHLTAKPRALDWIRAGALWAIGVTSFSAVRAVAVQPDEVIAVSAAAGRVGGLAAQLARRAGARLLGIGKIVLSTEMAADALPPAQLTGRSFTYEQQVACSGLDGSRVRSGQAGRVVGDVERGDEPTAFMARFVGELRVGQVQDAGPRADQPGVAAAEADEALVQAVVAPAVGARARPATRGRRGGSRRRRPRGAP